MDTIICYTEGRKSTKEEAKNGTISSIIIFGGGGLLFLILWIRACLAYYFGI